MQTAPKKQAAYPGWQQYAYALKMSCSNGKLKSQH